MSPQPATFPFDFIVMWIRPREQPDQMCKICNDEPIAYEMHQYLNTMEVLNQGADRAWMKAIHQQMNGNYRAAYYQPVCLDCCIHFAALALGKRRPIQQLLTMASLSKRQSGPVFSQVIVCTVNSINDEGDLWAVNAPNTRIDDAVRHLKTVEHK